MYACESGEWRRGETLAVHILIYAPYQPRVMELKEIVERQTMAIDLPIQFGLFTKLPYLLHYYEAMDITVPYVIAEGFPKERQQASVWLKELARAVCPAHIIAITQSGDDIKVGMYYCKGKRRFKDRRLVVLHQDQLEDFWKQEAREVEPWCKEAADIRAALQKIREKKQCLSH